MHQPTRTLLIATVLAWLLAACGGSVDEPTPDLGGGAEEPDPDDPAAGGSDALVGDEVEAAIEDAAATAGVEPADVQVLTSELVTWPDGSLGCPQPDEMYTQALVEGYRIVLEVAGQEIAYHGELGAEPFRCDTPEPPVG
jgi:hypothetical protein